MIGDEERYLGEEMAWWNGGSRLTSSGSRALSRGRLDGVVRPDICEANVCTMVTSEQARCGLLHTTAEGAGGSEWTGIRDGDGEEQRNGNLFGNDYNIAQPYPI